MLEIARSSLGECGRAVATYSLVPHGDKQRTRKTALFSMSRCRRAAWFDESRRPLARARRSVGYYKARASSTETGRALPGRDLLSALVWRSLLSLQRSNTQLGVHSWKEGEGM